MIAAALAAGWATMVDFSKSKVGRRVLVGAAGAAALSAGVLYARAHWIDLGVTRERAAQVERLKAARPAIDRVEKGGAEITAATEQHTQAEAERIRVVYRDLIKEVPTYVTPEADRRCDLPVGFVRLHDQAAAGLPEVSAPSSDVRDAPSGIPLSAASGVIVGNYGAAYRWRERAVACETWAASQADLWDRNIRTVSPP